jgi:hypothetical protein
MNKKILLLIGVFLLLGLGFVSIRYYSYVFSENVRGKIIRVERLNQAAVIGSGVTQEQLFSFAVAIKDEKGEIHTASSEDRQWSVATPGQCVEAKFYPYPFWVLDKSGTYHGARLLRLFECGSTAYDTE